MEIDSSPVPSPPPEAPSPPPDEDDFGLSSGLLQPQSNVSNNIRHDIMDALKSSGTANNSIAPPPTNNSHHQSQNIPSLAAMQQTFSQSWGTVPSSDNFAAMTAMIQQMLPGGSSGNNYFTPQPHPQPSTYNHHYQNQHHDPMHSAGAGSYHPAQGQSQVPGPDVSSIPLPPPSEIPLPPPTTPQLHHNNHHQQMNTIPNSMTTPPMGQNPYLNAYDTSTTTPSAGGGGGSVDSNEYVPLPYYKSQHDPGQDLNASMTYGAGLSMPDFDSSYNSTPSTPLNNQRYHPYHHPNETSNSTGGPHANPLLVSPSYSNHSGGSERFYGSTQGGNNSNISPTGAAPESVYDPSALFASALSKNKSGTSSHNSSGHNSQDFMGGSMSISGQENISSGGAFNPADSFYSPGGVFDGFANDESLSSE